MMRIILLLTAVYVSNNCIAQDPDLQTFEAFKSRAQYFLKSGGVWEAENPKHDKSNEWSPTTFGYKFETGYAENVFKIKINGKVKDKRYLYWDGYYYWDPVRRKACYRSVGTSGQVATGESINNDGDLMFEILHADGKITFHLDTDEAISENEFRSQSYLFEEGKWAPNNTLTWRRIVEPKAGGD
jgi:hypothetical protein